MTGGRRATRESARDRVGIGYDSHSSGPGQAPDPRWPADSSELRPRGHSDADAVAHALTDAILGAAASGDIGKLFPDSHPQWKDADSIGLLRTAVKWRARPRLPPVQADVIGDR